MSLILSEEQELLRETARSFVNERSPVSRLRELRDAADATGFSRELWREMGELGWTGIFYPEEYGGSELGFAELGIVLEECGRNLVPEPFLSTVVLGGSALLLGGGEQLRKDVLPGVCAGEAVLGFAWQEQARFAPYAVATRAEAGDSGFRLTGEKRLVQDGHVADQLVVVARTSGEPGARDGLTLFLVDARARGVATTRTIMVDGRNAALVQLDQVEVDRGRVLGEPDQGAELLDRVLDRGAVALAAELLGNASEAYDRTIAYLKTREQFGVPIGSFQALKHRAADLFCELELSRSIVSEALRAIDDERADASELASAAKARLCDTAIRAGCEGIQMHGGIGMTDEEEIGFFLKRARVAEQTLGDARYHRDRFGHLRGF